jgi:hypothetical protein
MERGAWSMRHGACGMELAAWSLENGAWEGRALRNDPVGHFSEGACLQGKQGASAVGGDKWSMGLRSLLSHPAGLTPVLTLVTCQIITKILTRP